jgi:hypothetical protein
MLHIVLSFGCGEWITAFKRQTKNYFTMKGKGEEASSSKLKGKAKSKALFTMKDMKSVKLKDAIRKAFTTKDTKKNNRTFCG